MPTPKSARTRSAAVVVALVCASALASAAPSLGAPGDPGVSSASDAVYAGPGGGGGAFEFPEDPGGAGFDPGASAETGAGDGGGLPFTGFVLPTLLALGLVALAAGIVAHKRATT